MLHKSLGEGVNGALSTTRVIDTSQGVAGGYCGRLLASLGADVVKVEPPQRGDRLRWCGPFVGDVPDRETSIPHLHLNAGNRGITLDVTTASGRSLMRGLLDRADVLLVDEALAPPSSPLSEDVQEIFPNLVVATITPFGLEAADGARLGARSEWRSADLVELALGGYLLMTGDPDREPLKPYGEQARFQAGLHAALGIVAALAARDLAPGAGQHVDVAAVEAAAFLVGGALQRWHFFGREARRDGARTVGMAPNFYYPSTIRPCAGGYVHAHVHNRFPELLAALTADKRLLDPDIVANPRGHANEIDELLDAWLATRNKWAAVEEAQELRLPFTEVLDPGEVVADRFGHHHERRIFTQVQHPAAGQILQVGWPIRMGNPQEELRRAPLLGEHNVDVYCGELGLARRTLARLSAAGVI